MPTPQLAPDDPPSGEGAEGDSAEAGDARDCGDFADHCASGRQHHPLFEDHDEHVTGLRGRRYTKPPPRRIRLVA